MSNEKKIVKVQTYTIEVIHYDDGMTDMKRTNDGFSVFGLIGILSLVINHLYGVVANSYKPVVDSETITATDATIFPKSNEE
jgi:hypothetical protein